MASAVEFSFALDVCKKFSLPINCKKDSLNMVFHNGFRSVYIYETSIVVVLNSQFNFF